MQLLRIYLFLVSAYFFAPTTFGMVIVHVHDMELRRPKENLIKESGYFKNLFSNVFLAPLIEADGFFHVQLCRNKDSMSAIWDFLQYGTIDETDRVTLNKMKKDADYLQINELSDALAILDQEKKERKKISYKRKLVILVGKGNESKNIKRTEALQNKIDKFFTDDNKRPIAISQVVFSGSAYGRATVSVTYKEKI